MLFKAVIDDGGMLDLWDRKLRRASKTLRSDPILQRDFYGSRMAKQIGVWAGAVTARNILRREYSTGKAWTPLSKATERHKNRYSGGRIDKKPRSKIQEPLIDSGQLFDAFAPFKGNIKRKSVSFAPKELTPFFSVSPKGKTLSLSPTKKKRRDGRSWEMLFDIHNKPEKHKTVLKKNRKWRKRTDSKGKNAPIEERTHGPVSIPGREFFYFTKDDLKTLGQMITYAALVGGPVDKKGRSTARGVKGVRTGSKYLLNQKQPEIEDMLNKDFKRVLEGADIIRMIKKIR